MFGGRDRSDGYRWSRVNLLEYNSLQQVVNSFIDSPNGKMVYSIQKCIMIKEEKTEEIDSNSLDLSETSVIPSDKIP